VTEVSDAVGVSSTMVILGEFREREMRRGKVEILVQFVQRGFGFWGFKIFFVAQNVKNENEIKEKKLPLSEIVKVELFTMKSVNREKYHLYCISVC